MKDQSILLAQNNSLFQGKLDQVLNENEQIMGKSDLILSHPKIMETRKRNIQILSHEIKTFQPKLPENINSIMSHSKLVDKIKKVKINKKIPRLHMGSIRKIISYDNNTKYITCSDDKTIIIRNSEDNTVIRTLIGHKDYVYDILLLSDGRLASSSQDEKIKIWNLTNDNCEQTLIGHSDWIYCLLELPNSILLSCSEDLNIVIWDISQKDKKELQFYHQVKNDKQSYAYCMTLINVNELAVSSDNNINIYSFDKVTIQSFNIIKTLKVQIGLQTLK